MTRRVASANATKIACSITLDNRFSGGESGVSFASGGSRPRRCRSPIPSISPMPNTAAWNSWALPKVAWNLAHQKLEFLNRNFLLFFFCLFAAPPPPLSFASSTPFPPPRTSGKTRRRLISVAPLNALSCQNERLSDLRFHLASLCSVDPEWESAYLPTNEGAMADVIPFFEARFVGILDFPIYCAAPRFDFPVYRALRNELSHLLHVTLCSLRQAQYGVHCLIPYRYFWSFRWYCLHTKIVIYLFLFFLNKGRLWDNCELPQNSYVIYAFAQTDYSNKRSFISF